MRNAAALAAALLVVGAALAASAWYPARQQAAGRAAASDFDVVIAGGAVYDGTGALPRTTDVGIRGDRIAELGDLSAATARTRVDARGLAVSPGFINMLSWADEDLLVDGRSQGDIRQGVTTEIFGEGWSMGPLTPSMKTAMLAAQGDLQYPVTWTTLGEFLHTLEQKGVSANVASFVGATTVRQHVLGMENIAPNAAQLDQMRALVRQAMQEGAIGVGSSLIYAPASYSTTDELIAMCKVASEFGGSYISHIRSEGDRLIEAIDELVRIAREARVAAEIYHLKAAGESNWPKVDAAIARIEDARRSGLAITANMYTYTAGATSLDSAIPPWAHEGGFERLIARILNGETRARILREMRTPQPTYENLYLATGSPERVLLVGFKSTSLKPLAGKNVAEIARMRGRDPLETVLDLIVEDHSGIGAVFFLMSEENVRRQLALPWVSLGSDAGSKTTDGVFLKSSTHPRAYGNFARFLGKYVRDEKVTTLHEAIRRMTSLPATNSGLADRGTLRPGAFADVVVFDPLTVTDRATYDTPHQYAVGVKHVFVNGTQVLADGEHTGARPGRALRRAVRAPR